MKYVTSNKRNKLAALLIVAVVVLCYGCTSSIEIIPSDRPVMTKTQHTKISEEFSKQINLGILTFEDSEEEKAFFFALQLYYSCEYYRAVTEFMRFISFYETSRYVSLAYFMIGESFRASDDYENAIFFYAKAKDNVVDEAKTLDFSWVSDFNIAVCHILKADYAKAKAQVAKLDAKYGETKDQDTNKRFFHKFMNLILLVAEKDYSGAAQVLKTLDRTQLQELTGVQIDENDVLKFDDLPTRNVGLSVIMSALVPGLGQLYADRPLEALTSFLLTGIFTFIAYEAFTEEQEVLGAVSTFLAASFYLANIYNSANAAGSFNENRRIEFYNRLINRLDSDILHFFIIPEETDEGVLLTFKVLR